MQDSIHKPRKGRTAALAAVFFCCVLISGILSGILTEPAYGAGAEPGSGQSREADATEPQTQTGAGQSREAGATEQRAAAGQSRETGTTEPQAAAGQAAVSGGDVILSAEYGFDNMAKGGRYLPLAVSIENGRETAIDGILQVKSMESDGTIYQYEYSMFVEPLAETEGHYYIPLGSNADQLFLTLVDGAGETVARRRLPLTVSRDVPDLFIGILSDEPWNLQYLNGIGVSYSTLRTRTFELEAETFPTEEIGLSLLDVLVVNNFKLRSLSEQQTAAIMDWVHNGGVLILGTGERVDDTLGRFAPELLDDSYENADIRHIDLGEMFHVNESGNGMLVIPCVDIPLHGGNVIVSSDGFALLTAAAKERGLIAVAAFDMGDISDFCEVNNGYVDFLLTSLLGENRINQLAEVVYSGNSSKFWSVQSLINTGDVDKLPNLMVYVAIIVVYLAILGPGLYIFLKNRELQIHYRKGVVILSVVFAGIIYVLGTATRFRSTFYTYATIQDVTADYVADTTYLNIRNPYNSPYQVELNGDYSILPITRSYYSDSSQSTEFTGDEAYQIAIRKQDDLTTVNGQNITSFAPRYFRLEKKSDNTEGIGITGEVDYFEGKISGTITNQFPYPLENATLLLYGNMVFLDRLEPGETKQLDDLALLRFPLNNAYVVAEQITGGAEFEDTDINDRDYLLAMERSNLVIFYFDNYMSGYTADARVIAFSTQKEESQFLKDPSEETYGVTMLTSSVAVNASRDRSIYRSVLMKEPTVISGSYDSTSNSMTGTEPMTLEYQLGTDISVESLTFETISEEFLDSAQSSYIEVFTGSIYFYNYGSGNFDLVDIENRTMDVEQLRPYLSPGNTLTVRYVYDGLGVYNSIQLPMPMAAGRER